MFFLTDHMCEICQKSWYFLCKVLRNSSLLVRVNEMLPRGGERGEMARLWLYTVPKSNHWKNHNRSPTSAQCIMNYSTSGFLKRQERTHRLRWETFQVHNVLWELLRIRLLEKKHERTHTGEKPFQCTKWQEFFIISLHSPEDSQGREVI